MFTSYLSASYYLTISLSLVQGQWKYTMCIRCVSTEKEQDETFKNRFREVCHENEYSRRKKIESRKEGRDISLALRELVFDRCNVRCSDILPTSFETHCVLWQIWYKRSHSCVGFESVNTTRFNYNRQVFA